MGRWRGISAGGALVALVSALAASSAIAQSAAAPPPATAAKVKELVALLQAKKLEAFAAKEPEAQGRYVGALLIPGVQLLVVAAKHGRASDSEYYLYQKDFMGAYMDLNSSAAVTERVFIEDALADGLVARPGKDLGRDTFRRDGTTHTFDGEVADPRRRNDKRTPAADYDRVFAEAEAAYTRALDVLIGALKGSFPEHPPLR